MSYSDAFPELSDSTVQSYDLLRFECGRYDLRQSGLVELTGEDRKGWLQGQVTNDMRSVTPGGSLAFCLCSPTGQMLAYCDLWALQDRFFVRTPKLCLPAFLERCENMIILEDVQYRDRTLDFRLISLQGPEATPRLRELLDLPTLDAGAAEVDGEPVICLRSNRTGLGGWDLLVPNGESKLAVRLEAAFEPIDDRAFNITRLEAGFPRFGLDMNEKTLPPEMGSAFESRTVSYSKGCYTGQEVLMRLHSRGHTNRTWMGIVAEEPFRVGATVRHRLRPDAGVVTSADESPQFGFIGAAMVRNEAAFDGESVTLETPEGRVSAELKLMPLLRIEG